MKVSLTLPTGLSETLDLPMPLFRQIRRFANKQRCTLNKALLLLAAEGLRQEQKDPEEFQRIISSFPCLLQVLRTVPRFRYLHRPYQPELPPVATGWTHVSRDAAFKRSRNRGI
jgi:hypothetical protein